MDGWSDGRTKWRLYALPLGRITSVGICNGMPSTAHSSIYLDNPLSKAVLQPFSIQLSLLVVVTPLTGLHSINQIVQDHLQAIANFLFTCDSFSLTVASIRKLLSSCLLA